MWAYRSWTFASEVLCLSLLLVAPRALASRCDRNRECSRQHSVGARAYHEERFEAALEAFNQAHQISHQSLLLLNIGCSLHNLHRYQEAIEKFEEFIRLRPDSRYLETAQGYLQEARSKLQPKPPPAAITPPQVAAGRRPGVELPPDVSFKDEELRRLRDHAIPVTQLPSGQDTPAAARAERNLSIWTSLVLTVGLAGVSTGVGCYLAVRSLREQFGSSSDEFNKRDMLERKAHLERASTAGYVIGGAATAAGTMLLGFTVDYARRRRKASRVPFQISVAASPGSGGLSLGGHY